MLFDLVKYKTNIAVICEEGNSYSYNFLNQISSSFSQYVESGSLAFCLCKNSIGSLLGYISLLENEIKTVMIDGEKDAEMIQNLLDIYSPQYIWLPTSRIYEFDIKETLLSLEGYSLVKFNHCFHKINSSLALLLTTSGSTGSPKLVRLSFENLQSNAESIAEYLDITDQERPITSLPMHYSYGLSVINSHLIKGATILLTDKAVIQKEFWSFAKEHKATSIAGVPYTYEMLRRLRFFRMDLPQLKTMTQAGGKLNSTLVKEFVDNAKIEGKSFYVMYGQTEATARMSYLPFEHSQDKSASIGIAIPGGEFSLIDADGKEIIEPDRDGELIYRGKNVSMGYAECIEDLAKGDENLSILHTGDIARRDSDGYYYITGRMKRFVKVWGNRCNLDAIEQFVKAITTNCACSGVDDHITIFVTEEGLDADIKSLLVMKTGLNVRAFSIKVIDCIPKNSSGKVQYVELQKMIDR